MGSIPFHLLLPECILLTGACAVLLGGVCGPKDGAEARRHEGDAVAPACVHACLALCALLTVLCAGVASFWGWATALSPQLLFSHSVVIDPFSYFVKGVLCAIAMPVFLYGHTYVTDRGLRLGEYYALILFSLLGMSVLASAYSLLTVFLSIELFSLPLYALVALRRPCAPTTVASDDPIPSNVEAAIKYFVMGALATGLLLYGFSFFYGLTGKMALPDIAAVLHQADAPPFVLMGFASACVLLGLAFKLGVVPAHMWVPDVYEAAPISVTYWIASVGKLASFAVLLRFLTVVLPPFQAYWQPVLLYFSLLSIAVGNIVGVQQTHFRRLLGYSSIAHMGYMLIGLWVAGTQGYTAALFYTVTYALISAAAFAGLLVAAHTGRHIGCISDFKGYLSTDPVMSMAWLVILFAMAGVPPFAGFIAKLHLILVVLSTPALPQAVWVIVFMLLLAVVGGYYYLRVVRAVFFSRDTKDTSVVPLPSYVAGCTGLTCLLRGGFLLHVFAVLWIGICPSTLWSACAFAVQHSMV